ncbi:MAG: glycosyltransferase family 2 protein, partial [Candidatus Binatia bacterium]
HGFCMYVKREALDDVGVFEEEAFGLGYGEENDWCMRASRLGWKHVLDDATYVYHEGGVSFGSEEARQALVENRRRLDEIHPEYGRRIGEFFARNPLHGLHEHLERKIRERTGVA